LAHDVFISYSHVDKTFADAVCHYLERSGIKCWYAPRDIEPGEKWARGIHEAMLYSKAFVLILSSHSNISEQVIREINLAVSKKMHIITFKIEDVEISKELEYYLGVSHWLDAITGPLDKHLVSLTHFIKKSLNYPGFDTMTSLATVTPSEEKHSTPKPLYKRKWIAILMILLMVSLGFFIVPYINEVINQSAYKHVKLVETNSVFEKQARQGVNFFSSDYQLYADLESNGLVIIRDTKTHKVLHTIKPTYVEANKSVNFFFSENKRQFIIMYPKNVEVYDLKSERLLYSKASDENSFVYAKFIKEDSCIVLLLGRRTMALSYGENGSDIFNQIQTLDANSGDIVYHYNWDDPFTFYGITHDGEYICTGQGEGLIYLHGTLTDVEHNGTEALALCHENVNFPPFDSQGRYLDSTYSSGMPGTECRIIRLSDGKTIFEHTSKEIDFHRLVDNNRVIISNNNSSGVYDILTGKKVISVAGYKNWERLFYYVIPDTAYIVGYEKDEYHGTRIMVLDSKTNKKIMSDTVITNPIFTSGAANFEYRFTKDKVIYLCDSMNGMDCMIMEYPLSLFDEKEDE